MTILANKPRGVKNKRKRSRYIGLDGDGIPITKKEPEDRQLPLDLSPQAKKKKVSSRKQRQSVKTPRTKAQSLRRFDAKYALDEDVYRVIELGADTRKFDKLGGILGVSGDTIGRSLDRLEKKGLIRRDPLPNYYTTTKGQKILRKNPKFRIVKLGSAKTIKVIDLFSAPHYETWKKKNRDQMIKRYLRTGWNVVPIKKDKKPIMSKEAWAALRTKQRLSVFSDQVFGIGLWIDDLIVFDFDNTRTMPDYDTLMTKSPHGYHCYFLWSPETRHIENAVRIAPNRLFPDVEVDTRARTGFVVLPPTKGYRWIKARMPAHVPKDLLTMWNHRKDKIKATGTKAKTTSDGSTSDTLYVLPASLPKGIREDNLFRYGRSLRAKGKTKNQIATELMSVNKDRCQPPVATRRLDKIIDRVEALEDVRLFNESRKGK